MDVKKYRVFVKTAELASLTRAAAALEMTQPAVSSALSQLEKALHLPLLKRGRSGARLTSEGAALLPYVQRLVQLEDDLGRLARSLAAEPAGTVRIATFTSVATHWLPRLMMDFQARYPKADFALRSGGYDDIEGWLCRGEVDVGFTTQPNSISLRQLPLYEDPLLAVLPPRHPLAAGAVCPLKRLSAEPFIALSRDRDMDRAVKITGRLANVRLRTQDDYAVIAMVRQGLGVSIMPSLLLRGQARGVVLRPLDPPVSRTICLAVAQPAPGTLVETFAAFAWEWVRQYGAPSPEADGAAGREEA